MTFVKSKIPFHAALGFAGCVIVSLSTGTAWAQPTPTPDAENPTPASPPPVTPSQTTGDTQGKEPTTGEEKSVVLSAPPALGFVERLPETAYPTYPIRGIYGGSLWRTFHGLEWPYYPKTGIGVSGDVWDDTGYEHVNNGAPNEASAKYLIQQVRVVLRMTPTWSNGNYFVQGQVELVGNNDQTQVYPNAASTDDAWIRFGHWNTWDVQFGRFQVWEIYHVGMGLDLYTQERNGAVLQNEVALIPPPIYVVNDRADLRSVGVGQAAVHLYPTKNLRFELASQFGSSAQNTLSVRPVGIYDLGWLKLKAGAVYEVQNDQSDGGQGSKTSRGVGGAIQFVIDPYIEFGGNGTYGLVDEYSSKDGSYDPLDSNTTYSVGGFVNVQPAPALVPDLLVGGGFNYTYLENQLFNTALNRNGQFHQEQAFVAVQYYLWRQLFIKAVGGYASADFAPTPAPSPYTNEMLSARLRLEYAF